jgi:transcriptional antiterminator RfaH
MAATWYALRSKTGKEESVWQRTRSLGFRTYYPHLYAHPVNPRARKFKPFFPGYLFVNADLVEVGQGIFDRMQNAIGLLRFGGEPAAIEERVVNVIKTRVDEIVKNGGELFGSLKQGDSVTIQSGPFAGYDAVFDTRLSDLDRVRVFVQFLNDRQVAVEMKAGQIKPRCSY